MHCRRERPDAQSQGLRACAARGTASRVIEASVEHLRRAAHPAPKEVGGREGPDPTRYGDWEKGGIASDF